MLFVALPHLLLFLSSWGQAATVVEIHPTANCSTDADVFLLGPDDGVCQSISYAVGGFRVLNLDPGCVVTAYDNDALYCDSKRRFVAALNHCYDVNTIGGYSIDECTSSSHDHTSQAAAPTTTSTRPSLSTPSAQGSNPGLSASDKIAVGIGIGLGIPGLAIPIIFGVRQWNRR